jgi:hypothetical protein
MAESEDWYKEVVERQYSGPLTETELKEWRAQLELDRNARRLRRRMILWLKYSAIAITSASALSQTQGWLVQVFKSVFAKTP